MLASTVQFSRNAPRQPPRHPPSRGKTARRPARERTTPPAGAGSLRTQQRAQPHQPPGTPVPAQAGRTDQVPGARPAE